MFGLFTFMKRDTKLEKELLEHKAKIEKLEEAIEMMNMNLTNIQTAVIANSRCQDSISYDISRIGEIMSAVLEASELNVDFTGPGGESGSGSGTIH